MHKDGPMTTRDKLAKMLAEKLGFEVRADDLIPAKGFYRTSHFSECLRWEGFVGGHSIGSWDTMTKCIRNGFEISEGREINNSGMRYEAHANE
jgi:hypothetical protein